MRSVLDKLATRYEWIYLFIYNDTVHRANFEFKGKHSHRSISICQKQLL